MRYTVRYTVCGMNSETERHIACGAVWDEWALGQTGILYWPRMVLSTDARPIRPSPGVLLLVPVVLDRPVHCPMNVLVWA